MYPPGGSGGSSGGGGVPLRSLNNKPTSQGDLSYKIQAAAAAMATAAAQSTGTNGVGASSRNYHHHSSLTDIENKSSGSFDGPLQKQTSHPATTTSTLPSAHHNVAGQSMLATDPDLSFLEQITRMQSKRLDDQRCSLKPPSSSSLNNNNTNNNTKSTNKSSGKGNSGSNGGGSTIPNEDFFDLIIKSQRTR